MGGRKGEDWGVLVCFFDLMGLVGGNGGVLGGWGSLERVGWEFFLWIVVVWVSFRKNLL